MSLQRYSSQPDNLSLQSADDMSADDMLATKALKQRRFSARTMTDIKTKVVKGMVKSDIKLNGKTAVITGCNTGIGYETMLDLSARGARIIMACRDVAKAEAAREKVLEQVKDADLVIKKLDLASLESVRECAKDINENESRIDLLINNAGVMMCPHWKTKDGFEMQMGTNHIGHFLFTNLLLDLIKKSAPSRIVIVSSAVYAYGRIDWDNLMFEGKYNGVTAYSQSKLANIMHCLELSKRLEGTGVTCNVVHPGMINTELVRHISNTSHLSMRHRIGLGLLKPFFRFILVTPKKGAQTTIYCAIAPELENVSGKYFSNCAEEPLKEHARNEQDANMLWKLSEEWTKENCYY